MENRASIQDDLPSRSRHQKKDPNIRKNCRRITTMIHSKDIHTLPSEGVAESAFIESAKMVQGVAWGFVLSGILWTAIGTMLWIFL